MAELMAAGGECVGFFTIAGMKPRKQTRTGWRQAKASKACFRQSASARQAPAPSASFAFKTHQRRPGTEPQSLVWGGGSAVKP